MDNNQIDNNDVAFAPSVDAIQEFNIISQTHRLNSATTLAGDHRQHEIWRKPVSR